MKKWIGQQVLAHGKQDPSTYVELNVFILGQKEF